MLRLDNGLRLVAKRPRLHRPERDAAHALLNGDATILGVRPYGHFDRFARNNAINRYARGREDQRAWVEVRKRFLKRIQGDNPRRNGEALKIAKMVGQQRIVCAIDDESAGRRFEAGSNPDQMLDGR
jgi:hypothetical protein